MYWEKLNGKNENNRGNQINSCIHTVAINRFMSVKSSTELMLYVCKNSDFKLNFYTLYFITDEDDGVIQCVNCNRERIFAGRVHSCIWKRSVVIRTRYRIEIGRV